VVLFSVDLSPPPSSLLRNCHFVVPFVFITEVPFESSHPSEKICLGGVLFPRSLLGQSLLGVNTPSLSSEPFSHNALLPPLVEATQVSRPSYLTLTCSLSDFSLPILSPPRLCELTLPLPEVHIFPLAPPNNQGLPPFSLQLIWGRHFIFGCSLIWGGFVLETSSVFFYCILVLA